MEDVGWLARVDGHALAMFLIVSSSSSLVPLPPEVVLACKSVGEPLGKQLFVNHADELN